MVLHFFDREATTAAMVDNPFGNQKQYWFGLCQHSQQ
jgi:hypothetical protein